MRVDPCAVHARRAGGLSQDPEQLGPRLWAEDAGSRESEWSCGSPGDCEGPSMASSLDRGLLRRHPIPRQGPGHLLTRVVNFGDYRRCQGQQNGSWQHLHHRPVQPLGGPLTSQSSKLPDQSAGPALPPHPQQAGLQEPLSPTSSS